MAKQAKHEVFVESFKILSLRMKAGITQKELADRAGISQGMISQLETKSRNCRRTTLDVIAKELNVSTNEISGQPTIFIRFMRNCEKLNAEQLLALNEVVLRFTTCRGPKKSGS